MGIYQTKNLLQAKGNINRVKKQASTNYIGINFQTNKEFLQLKKKNPKPNNSFEKLARGLNRQFSKEDIQMASGCMKNG